MNFRGSYCPPPYEVEVVKAKGVAVLRFYDGVVEVNEVDEGGGGATFIGWEFDRYTITRPYDPGLAARIERDVPAWLDMAKREECDALADTRRAERTDLLFATDHTQLPDKRSKYTVADVEEYSVIREILKRLPEHGLWPHITIPRTFELSVLREWVESWNLIEWLEELNDE